jgi:hypothetical protein
MAKGTKTGGRKAGTPNKITAALKEAILLAADNAGGEGGMVGYLTRQASENPPAFLSLLGKVLPMTVNAEHSGNIGVTVEIVRFGDQTPCG